MLSAKLDLKTQKLMCNLQFHISWQVPGFWKLVISFSRCGRRLLSYLKHYQRNSRTEFLDQEVQSQIANSKHTWKILYLQWVNMQKCMMILVLVSSDCWIGKITHLQLTMQKPWITGLPFHPSKRFPFSLDNVYPSQS